MCALALVVNHGRGQEPVLITRLDDAVTQVDILAIHEKVFIKAMQLLEHIGAAQHVSTRQDVDALRLGVTQVAQVILGEQRGTREQFGKTENLAERHPWCRECPFALGQEHAIGIHHPGSNGTTLGMRTHPCDALLQALRCDDGVRIENERELPVGLHDGLIIGPCKTHIILILNESDLRMALSRKFNTVVTRQVIDNNYLARHIPNGLFHCP